MSCGISLFGPTRSLIGVGMGINVSEAGNAFVGASNIWMWENGIGFQWESGIFMNVE